MLDNYFATGRLHRCSALFHRGCPEGSVPAGASLCLDLWVYSQSVGGRQRQGKVRTHNASFRVPQPGCTPKRNHSPASCPFHSAQAPCCSDNALWLVRLAVGWATNLVQVLTIFCISSKTSYLYGMLFKCPIVCAVCFLLGTCLLHTSQPAHWQRPVELLSHHRLKLGTWRSRCTACPLLYSSAPD